MAIQISYWQPSPKDAVDSGVLQMREVTQIARASTRGMILNGRDALTCFVVDGDGTKASINFTEKFARVDVVFAKDTSGGNVPLFIQKPGESDNPAIVTCQFPASGSYFLTVIGTLIDRNV